MKTTKTKTATTKASVTRTVAKGAKKKATRRQEPPTATAPRPASKGGMILALIGRSQGATLPEIMAATGWQKHSVRGFISTAGKKGAKIESSKSAAGERTYILA